MTVTIDHDSEGQKVHNRQSVASSSEETDVNWQSKNCKDSSLEGIGGDFRPG